MNCSSSIFTECAVVCYAWMKKLITLLQLAPHADLTEEIGPTFNKETWINVKGGQHGRGLRSLAGIKPSIHPSSVPYLPPSPRPPNGFPHTHRELGSEEAPGVPVQMNTREINTLNITTALDSDDERNFPSNCGTLTKHLETQMETMKLNGFEKRFHGKVTQTVCMFSHASDKGGLVLWCYSCPGGHELEGRGHRRSPRDHKARI